MAGSRMFDFLIAFAMAQTPQLVTWVSSIGNLLLTPFIVTLAVSLPITNLLSYWLVSWWGHWPCGVGI